MTIDDPVDQNTSVSNKTIYRPEESLSFMNIMFPNIRRSASQHSFSSDDFEDCPNDASSDPAYEGASVISPVAPV